ncbi:MAG: restriction endonuclease subunit S [Spirochaetia bacterium]|nr:restriction endonuclease subunit S [Spirochaetia bacterium]
MIEGLKPYPQYNSHSSDWFGDIPNHWALKPNRAIFSEIKDRDHATEEMLSVTITRGIIRQKALLEGSSKRDSSNQNKTAYKLVQPRDLAYNKMRAWQGAIGASAFRGIISPAYVVMRFRSPDHIPNYFHHLYRIPQFAKEAERWSYGITSDMWSLRPEHFKLILTPLPPPDEQAAIVHFLDYANARIERAIRAKKKIVSLLNEQKQAIIHRAVTRGLDPNVKMKDSGIPWLGEIPEHWEVRRLKVVAEKIVDCLHATPKYSTEGTYPAIRTADISPGVVHLKKAKRIPAAEYARWTERLAPRAGDILYSREGERFGIAACVPTGVKLCISQRMMVFRVKDEFDSEFVMHLLNGRATYRQALQDALGATVPHVNISTIRNYTLGLPNRAEQSLIIEYIRSETSSFSEILLRTEREISLLREYRTRLTADVVTGKLDVREAAKNLPSEDPNPDIADDLDIEETELETEEGQ